MNEKTKKEGKLIVDELYKLNISNIPPQIKHNAYISRIFKALGPSIMAACMNTCPYQ